MWFHTVEEGHLGNEGIEEKNTCVRGATRLVKRVYVSFTNLAYLRTTLKGDTTPHVSYFYFVGFLS